MSWTDMKISCIKPYFWLYSIVSVDDNALFSMYTKQIILCYVRVTSYCLCVVSVINLWESKKYKQDFEKLFIGLIYVYENKYNNFPTRLHTGSLVICSS